MFKRSLITNRTRYVPDPRVELGAAFLDRHRPGWRSEITPRYLRLSSPYHCVLGQIYGSFWEGQARLHLLSREARKLGFYAETLGEYDTLTEEWKAWLAAHPEETLTLDRA